MIGVVASYAAKGPLVLVGAATVCHGRKPVCLRVSIGRSANIAAEMALVQTIPKAAFNIDRKAGEGFAVKFSPGERVATYDT